MTLHEDAAKREQAIAREEYIKNKEKILQEILNLFKSDVLNKSEIKSTLTRYLPATLDFALEELLHLGKISTEQDKNKGDRGITYKINLK